MLEILEISNFPNLSMNIRIHCDISNSTPCRICSSSCAVLYIFIDNFFSAAVGKVDSKLDEVSEHEQRAETRSSCVQFVVCSSSAAKLLKLTEDKIEAILANAYDD